MSAFAEIDFTRFDFWAIVVGGGIAVVEAVHCQQCHDWLRREGYTISASIDFGDGIGPAVGALGKLLKWEEQFGYELKPESRNLDALRDGFEFEVKPGHGVVLELLNAEVAYREDSRWFLGLLSIAREHSLRHLSLGERFFTCLILDRDSPLIGVAYETESIPMPYRNSSSRREPFD